MFSFCQGDTATPVSYHSAEAVVVMSTGNTVSISDLQLDHQVGWSSSLQCQSFHCADQQLDIVVSSCCVPSVSRVVCFFLS